MVNATCPLRCCSLAGQPASTLASGDQGVDKRCNRGAASSVRSLAIVLPTTQFLPCSAKLDEIKPIELVLPLGVFIYDECSRVPCHCQSAALAFNFARFARISTGPPIGRLPAVPAWPYSNQRITANTNQAAQACLHLGFSLTQAAMLKVPPRTNTPVFT